MSDCLQETPIGTIDQIPRGEGRTFEIAGKRIAVFRTYADEAFATQAECPHRRGPLADGMLGGTVVVCPLHDRSFDLRTGKELGGGCPIAVYPVRRDEDGVLLLTLRGGALRSRLAQGGHVPGPPGLGLA